MKSTAFPGERGRLEQLEELFRAQFGSTAGSGVVRAPGRVNLIGEHLDYNGLPALPMALDRGITLLFRPRDDSRVRLFNADPFHQPIDDVLGGDDSYLPKGDWGEFVRASASSLSSRCGNLRGFEGVLGGGLPIAAGLSTSTALMVAVARALIAVNRLDIEPLDLIECLSQGERGVGAPGGAMDQAACISGKPNAALKVEFEPLTLSSIPIPDGWQFIIAYSLVKADKAGAVEQACRTRIAQCREILRALEAAGVRGSESYPALLATHEVDELLDVAGQILRRDMLRRFRHVITESRRVRQAERMLGDQNIEAFGGLMYESHSSLADDFEVSHPALDRLVELCAREGARGARLTGAGFGGSIVALCDGSAASLIDALRRDFYATDASATKEPDGGDQRLVFRV